MGESSIKTFSWATRSRVQAEDKDAWTGEGTDDADGERQGAGIKQKAVKPVNEQPALVMSKIRSATSALCISWGDR